MYNHINLMDIIFQYVFNNYKYISYYLNIILFFLLMDILYNFNGIKVNKVIYGSLFI